MLGTASSATAQCSPADIVALIEAVDWNESPVGPRSTWPQSLQTSLSIMINSGFPMLVMWGRDLAVFYNGGYAPILGEKHPWAMGRPMHQIWPEIWDTIGPMLHGVLQTGTATYDEDLLLPLHRNGFLEECYFTFSYSPIGERGGGIGGIFCAVAETSRKVIAERRLRIVHELEAKVVGVRNVEQVCRVASEVLGRNQIDVPFVRIYLFDKNARLRLVDACGPEAKPDEEWPVDTVARLRSPQIITSPIEAATRLIEPVKVRKALVLPLAAVGEESAMGAIVIGLSPFSALNDEYRPFLDVVTGQIAASINAARPYEETALFSVTTGAKLARDVAMKSEKFLRMLADTIPQMVWTAEPGGQLDYFNRRFYDFTGMSESEALEGDRWLSAFHPDDVGAVHAALRTAIATGDDFSVEARIRDKDGRYRWFLSQGVALKTVDGVVMRWFAAATDINDQKLLEERQRFVAHASSVLASSLDIGAILQKITELCVPALADWCQVQVLSSDDALHVEAVNHRDPKLKEELERLLGRQVISRTAPTGSPQVLRTATMRRLDEAECRRAVRENVAHAADRRIYANAGLGNAIIVPLVARGQVLGILHLVNMDHTKAHSESALAIAEELARRAALSIDNSRLYEREHRVATALQQAMLPTHLPNVAQVEFSSVYRPAERESQVGGDWYDAFVVAGDKIAVSIGDVGGHGLGAAVAMSEARQALRVSALEGLPPSEVLRRANSAVALNDKTPIITAVFGTIDTARGKFTFSSAGHPQAILAPVSRDAYYLPGGGIPLGTSSEASFPNCETDLEPYSTLLLYTDGVIEFSRDIETESARLLDAMDGRVSDTIANGAQAIVDYMLTARQMDDIAVLLATFLPDKAVPLDVTLDADRYTPSIARRLAARFARVSRLSPDRTFNLVLAVGEGVANAIEHAYRGRAGLLHFRLSMLEDNVLGEIHDEGRWRDDPPSADRGRGLRILRTITKRLQLQNTTHGTSLTFEV